MTRKLLTGLLAGLAFALCATSAVAQGGGGQSLQSQASDPTASLMSFQIQTFYSPNLYNTTGSQNVARFRDTSG